MTFDARESSRSLGEPIKLYFIRHGNAPDAYYAYTNAEQVVEHEFDEELGPVEFMPIPIMSGRITASGSIDKAALEIRTPQDAELAAKFRLHPPSQVITLVIMAGHIGDTEFLVEWVGRVLNAGRQGNEAVYTCEPISTSVRRIGLRRNYQHQCPHVLYGDKCQADREAATIELSVTAVAGALVSLPSDWSATPDRYVGGIASWVTPEGSTEERTIVKRADSDTLILSGVAQGLSPGTQIKLAWGCSHRVLLAGATLEGDCIDLHDNILNYGGQLWIPLKNPIGITNNFY